MKILALTAAALLSATTLAPAQADAQPRHGWHGNRGYHGGWNRGYNRGWNRGHYRAGYGYGRGYYRGRGRVVCRIHRGYYGPVRRCSRVW